MTTAEKTIPRLKERYRGEIVPALREEFGYGNVMQIPGLVKVVVNMGVGDAARDSKLIDGALRDLATITGQSREDQAAMADKLANRSSLIGAIVSGVMPRARCTAHSSFCSVSLRTASLSLI